MKHSSIALGAAAAALTLCVSVGSGYAYFSDYTSASGTRAVYISSGVTPHESFSNWTKQFTVTADEDSGDVWVRARGFAGSTLTLNYGGSDARWQDGGDGWYYYSEPLAGGEETGPLVVAISGIPEDLITGDQFNVTVVDECVPVLYGEDGNPSPVGCRDAFAGAQNIKTTTIDQNGDIVSEG